MAELDGSSSGMNGGQAAELKRRSVAGLNGLNFFVADMLTGFGPFVTIYLTANGWQPTDIGFALSVGTIAAIAGQVTAGLDGSVWRLAGGHELWADRHDWPKQDPFVRNDRGRSGSGACLPAKTRDSTAPHRCCLPRASRRSKRKLERTGTRRSPSRAVSANGRRSLDRRLVIMLVRHLSKTVLSNGSFHVT
jgi:hypothetical protein